MKNYCNIIECCNDTRQGAPHTGEHKCACASDLGDAGDVTCSFFCQILLIVLVPGVM